MPDQFGSWFDFMKFSDSVKQKSRFIHEPLVMEFLNTLLRTSSKRHRSLEKGTIVWRAQQGCDIENRTDINDDVEVTYPVELPYGPSRMKPLSYSAHEGRINPKGISCLYVASDEKTAMSEVRPWLGSYVSIGQFEIKKNITLVDFSAGHDSKGKFFFKEPDPEEREKVIWQQVDRAFSVPIGTDVGQAEYVPTQIISEFLKNQGFDGVVYKSNLGPGLNFGLFDLEVADLINCALCSVKKIDFEFGPREMERVVRRKK